MNPLNDFLNIFNLSIVIKIGILFAELFLIIFLTVVWRQVSSMNRIVTDTNDATFITSLALLLLLIAISLFAVSIVIL